MTPQDIPPNLWPGIAWAEVDLQLVLSGIKEEHSGPTPAILNFLKLSPDAQGLTRLQEMLSELRKEIQ